MIKILTHLGLNDWEGSTTPNFFKEFRLCNEYFLSRENAQTTPISNKHISY